MGARQCFFLIFVVAVARASSSSSTAGDDNNGSAEVTLYYVGLTSALVYYGKGGEISRCRLFLETAEDRARHPDDKGYEGHDDDKKIKISFTEMMDVIKQCKDFGGDPREDLNDTAAGDDWSPWTLFRGILPGTKWCGVNDLASNYNDLGTNRELDKCCREHDHCPIRVHGFQSRFGVYNPSLYTRSHCDCDDEFYDCVKDQKTKESDLVGLFYFDALGVRCIAEDYPKKCANQGLTCTQWEPDLTQPKTYVLVSGKNKW